MPADQLTAERLGCGLEGGAPGSANAAPQAPAPAPAPTKAKPSPAAKPESSDGELTIVPVGESGPSKYGSARDAAVKKSLADSEQSS